MEDNHREEFQSIMQVAESGQGRRTDACIWKLGTKLPKPAEVYSVKFSIFKIF